MSHLEATTPTRIPLLALAVSLAVLALTACASTPAIAQPAAHTEGAPPRAHQYVVSGEHAAALAPQATGQESFLEVSGTGSVTVLPDRVQASFAVETRAADAAQAAAENAELMDRVIRALRGAGIPGLEVETFGYALNPQYAVTDPPRSRVIDGYAALNNIRVTANDVTAAGTLVDAAIGAGANRVAGLGFLASDTEAARREALSQAVRSARLQAEAMADALGYVLGAPLEVHGGAQIPYPRRGGEVMFRAEAAMDTPIEAGDLTVSANVTVRFALGPAKEGR